MEWKDPRVDVVDSTDTRRSVELTQKYDGNVREKDK